MKKITVMIMLAFLLVNLSFISVKAEGGKETESSQEAETPEESESSKEEIVLKIPANLKAETTYNQITLSWGKVDKADGYQIEYAEGNEWIVLVKTKSLSYQHKNLITGKKYIYRISAYKEIDGEVIYSNAKTIGVTPILLKVTGIKAVQTGATSIKISWSKVTGANGYRVYVKKADGWKKLADVTSLNYSAKKLNTNSKYTYTVRAYRVIDGEKVFGTKTEKEVSAVPRLDEVTDIKATGSGSSIKLSWKKTADADGYRVYLNVEDEWEKVADVTKTTYTHTKRTVNTKYIYTVRAYRIIDNKKVFAVDYNQTGVTEIIIKKPTQPTNLTVTSGSGKITVKWNKVTGADYYYIYRQTAGSSKWTLLDKVKGGSTTSYADKKVTKSHSYVYAVSAAVNDGSVVGEHAKRGVYCVYNSEKAYRYAENIVNSVTSSSMSKLERLKACYKWYYGRTKYARSYEDPLYLSGNSWIARYARNLFTRRKANCYRHACSFAYMAKVVGYEPKVVVGVTHGVKHGWVEITMDGTPYVFDLRPWRGRGYYKFKVKYKNYSCKVNRKYSLPA